MCTHIYTVPSESLVRPSGSFSFVKSPDKNDKPSSLHGCSDACYMFQMFVLSFEKLCIAGIFKVTRGHMGILPMGTSPRGSPMAPQGLPKA